MLKISSNRGNKSENNASIINKLDKVVETYISEEEQIKWIIDNVTCLYNDKYECYHEAIHLKNSVKDAVIRKLINEKHKIVLSELKVNARDNVITEFPKILDFNLSTILTIESNNNGGIKNWNVIPEKLEQVTVTKNAFENFDGYNLNIRRLHVESDKLVNVNGLYKYVRKCLNNGEGLLFDNVTIGTLNEKFEDWDTLCRLLKLLMQIKSIYIQVICKDNVLNKMNQFFQENEWYKVKNIGSTSFWFLKSEQ